MIKHEVRLSQALVSVQFECTLIVQLKYIKLKRSSIMQLLTGLDFHQICIIMTGKIQLQTLLFKYSITECHLLRPCVRGQAVSTLGSNRKLFEIV